MIKTMTLKKLMDRLNEVYIGNEDILKDVPVKLACAGCVFDLEDIAPDTKFPMLLLGDFEYIHKIWPKLKNKGII